MLFSLRMLPPLISLHFDYFFAITIDAFRLITADSLHTPPLRFHAAIFLRFMLPLTLLLHAATLIRHAS